MKPLITLIKQKERFYEMAIQSILKEEIPWSLHGKVNSQLGSSNQDPVSAGQRFSCSTKGEMPMPVCRERKPLQLLYLAIAGLAKIAVKSLSTFLQQKRNKAMSQGLNAIRNDQSFGLELFKATQK